jgi:putative toxin-antitoxin system antitoxin component (TIGR02293 family)
MTAIARIQHLLGGEQITGPLRSDLDVVRLVRLGVPTQAVDHFLAISHLTFTSIERHVMARRTFKRRQDAAQRLDPMESDRLLRLVRLVAAADETFGNAEKALTWLVRENRALDGQTPLSLADTDLGARSVETLLGQIGHGLAA